MDSEIFEYEAFDAELMKDGTVSGPDMEYAPHFLALHLLAQHQEERQVGDAILPAREPDWAEVLSSAMNLMCQTRDIRIAVIAAEAAVNRYGILGLSKSLELIASWVVNYWDSVYPLLWLDGEYDPFYRSNAVTSLIDPLRLLKNLRSSYFIKTPIGGISINLAEKIHKGLDFDSDVIGTRSELMKAIAEAKDRKYIEELLRLSLRSIDSIESHFKVNVSEEFWPNLTDLSDLISVLLSIFDGANEVLIKKHGDREINHGEVSVVDCGRVAKGGVEHLGYFSGINSSIDAFLMLEMVREYFEKHEPSHPAPLMIKRIERLNGKSFLEMLQDLTPDGLSQLSLIAGADCRVSL